MRHHDDRHTFLFELVEHRGELALEECVDTLGRLVEQKNFRLGEQDFRECGTLLLATREVEGIRIEQALDVGHFDGMLDAAGTLGLGQTG